MAEVAFDEAAIAAEMQYAPAASLDAARAAAVRALTVRRSLERRAVEIGLLAPDEKSEPAIVEAIESLLEAEVAVPAATEAACRAEYDTRPEAYKSPDLLEASHILFAAAPDDGTACATALAAAKATLAEIERAPDRFEALARERSACPSAANGGWLGQVVRGTTVPEFETYLFSLDEGETCAAPVATRYGYHVVKLLRRAAGRPLPYDAVRARIAHRLEDRAYREGLAAYLRDLASRGGAERD